MESFVILVIAAVIVAVLLYLFIYAIVSNYFVKEGTTDEVDVTKAIIVVVLFALLWIALAYWGRDYVTY